MEKRTARYIVLVSIVLMAVSLFLDGETFAVCSGAPFVNRFLYHFFHASFLHYAINAWCLLSIAFTFEITVADLVVGFLGASLIPVTWQTPTIGLSGLCFVLFGRFSYCVQKKLKYHSYIGACIALGLLMPGVNGIIHLFCYAVGLIYGLLITPFRWKM